MGAPPAVGSNYRRSPSRCRTHGEVVPTRYTRALQDTSGRSLQRPGHL